MVGPFPSSGCREVHQRPDADGTLAVWNAITVARQDQLQPSSLQNSIDSSPRTPVMMGRTESEAPWMSDAAVLLNALQQYSTRSRFERYARHLIARHVDESKINDLREMFRGLDKKRTGGHGACAGNLVDTSHASHHALFAARTLFLVFTDQPNRLDHCSP